MRKHRFAIKTNLIEWPVRDKADVTTASCLSSRTFTTISLAATLKCVLYLGFRLGSWFPTVAIQLCSVLRVSNLPNIAVSVLWPIDKRETLFSSQCSTCRRSTVLLTCLIRQAEFNQYKCEEGIWFSVFLGSTVFTSCPMRHIKVANERSCFGTPVPQISALPVWCRNRWFFQVASFGILSFGHRHTPAISKVLGF